MKRLFCCAFLFSFFTIIESCKKDFQTPDSIPAPDVKLLMQKWTWISSTQSFVAYPEGNYRQVFSADSYSDFRADGLAYSSFPPNYDTSGYRLKDSTLSFFYLQNGQVVDSSDAKILTLNANTLVFSFPKTLFIEDTITGVETIYAGDILDSLKR